MGNLVLLRPGQNDTNGLFVLQSLMLGLTHEMNAAAGGDYFTCAVETCTTDTFTGVIKRRACGPRRALRYLREWSERGSIQQARIMVSLYRGNFGRNAIDVKCETCNAAMAWVKVTSSLQMDTDTWCMTLPEHVYDDTKHNPPFGFRDVLAYILFD